MTRSASGTIGSIARRRVAHAACPVTVVPPAA
jgi:hypothetical protein